MDFGDHIGVHPPAAVDEDGVAGLELVQVAENLAVDVVVRRQHQVARLAGVGGARVLPHALLELLPAVTHDDGRIHADGRDLDADGLLGPGRGEGQRGLVGLRVGAQVFGDFGFVGPRAAGRGGGRVPAGQHHGAHQGRGRQGGLGQGRGHFRIQGAQQVETVEQHPAQTHQREHFHGQQQAVGPGAARGARRFGRGFGHRVQQVVARGLRGDEHHPARAPVVGHARGARGALRVLPLLAQAPGGLFGGTAAGRTGHRSSGFKVWVWMSWALAARW